MLKNAQMLIFTVFRHFWDRLRQAIFCLQTSVRGQNRSGFNQEFSQGLFDKECTGDRQKYHTDRTLHIRNVQGTEIIIHMNNEWKFHKSHTVKQSQIVAYLAATFAAKNFRWTARTRTWGSYQIIISRIDVEIEIVKQLGLGLGMGMENGNGNCEYPQSQEMKV